MMIVYLKGLLESKREGECIVDVNGVGYLVEISNQTLETLPKTGDKITIHIYHHITENDQRLFGFADHKEKNLFERLLTVKGIGPKSALTILSGMPAPVLMEAIVTENTRTLSGISGIGKKTAERIILELKDKLFDETQPSIISGDPEVRNRHDEAISALEALGFNKKEAGQMVSNISGRNPKATVSEIVKMALVQTKR